MSDFDFKIYEDVEQLPIETGLDNELCQIMYTDEYKQVMGIARKMMQDKEYSERALILTSKVIDLVSAFYTIWNYRFSIVESLLENSYSNDKQAFVNKEMDWLDDITLNNPKNYQIWSYRQALLNIHPSPDMKRELPILQIMIDEDTKNYHVWSYRKWCVQFFQDYTNELQYTDSLIQRDVYNNSAWTHRMFVLKYVQADTEMVRYEIDYTKEKIEFVPQNVSSWNYLRGLYEIFLEYKYDEEIIEFAKTFTNNILDIDVCREETVSQFPPIESSFALEFLADVYSQDSTKCTNAIKALSALALKYDPIRKGLWNYKINKLT